ncbi:MAG: hypothetical protein V8R46_05315 [Eubacterium ramulus]
MNRHGVWKEAAAVEKEFSDSMQQRLEKGYILPGQMDVLYSHEAVTAEMQRLGCVLVSAMELRAGTDTDAELFLPGALCQCVQQQF